MRRARPVLLAAVVALTTAAGVAACSSSADPAATTSSEAAGPSFAIDADFPDPDVLVVGGTYYAYATNSPAAHVQLATSPDARTWTVSSTNPLPTLPSWASPGKTWAPDVSQPRPGVFVMYVVVAATSPGLQCIAVATSSSPEGPFAPAGTGPIVCPEKEGGAIDPATFVDTDGKRYLVWKNDGNCCHLDTWLQIAPLSEDGLTLTGAPTKLVKQTAAWEGSLVEAPTLVHHGTSYVLLYSANNYGDGSYATGYATSSALLGPYRKHDTPLLSTESSHDRFVGPGGQDVVTTADGQDLLVFHSWAPGFAYRGMDVLPLAWQDDQPVVTP